MEEKESLLKIILSCSLLIVGFFWSNNIGKIIIYGMSYVIISFDMYIEYAKKIKTGELFDENILMIVATIGAFYLKNYEEGILVILLFQIGEYLSDLAISKSKKSITKMMDLRTDKITLENNSTIPVESAKIGDIFIVKPGDRIPLDGIVIKGCSYLDTSSLTGESIPRRVEDNSTVLSGCINKSSILTIKATKDNKTSTAQRIIELIESEEEKKSKTEKWITKFAKIYTPVIFLISLLLLMIPLLLGQDMNTWVYKSLIFIVTACPCALVLSIPLGYFCGIGKCSKEGILIKGANELEKLLHIDYMIFDKTGTLTEGRMQVEKINIEKDEKDILQRVASIENNSNHPIAEAIKEKNNKELLDTSNYEEFPGRGISCDINNDHYLLGNEKWMKENKIAFEKEKTSNTVVYISINQEYVGNIVIADLIKDSAYHINQMHPRKVILSGDNVQIVKEVAEKLKIDTYYAELLPTDKAKMIEEYKKKGRVLFVGDGINDALVLATADVGISLGKMGTDAALEASDVVLMNDNLEKIEESIEIAKYTHKKIIENVVFALCIKLIVLFFGLLGKSTVLIAVFADVGVTLLSVINVLMIFFHKTKKTN